MRSVFKVCTVLKLRHCTVSVRVYTQCIYICWNTKDAVTEPVDRVYICMRDCKMPLPIKNPADCEVRAVTHCLTKDFLTFINKSVTLMENKR